MITKITAEQALEILENDDAQQFPFRLLNEQGQSKLIKWVLDSSKHPTRQNMEAHYRDVESKAPGNDPVSIEMCGHMTKDGHPIVLHLDKSDFDWFVGE